MRTDARPTMPKTPQAADPEPQIDIGARNAAYVVVTVRRADERPKIAVLGDGTTLTIAAPNPGEHVTVAIEAVDDHC
ncbi:MAG: hypothetical protein OXQ29_11890 [Rhodospirillaceae bacterium]|nr:hypothetical protein [Rhodospirillaceae bacterium]